MRVFLCRGICSAMPCANSKRLANKAKNCTTKMTFLISSEIKLCIGEVIYNFKNLPKNICSLLCLVAKQWTKNHEKTNYKRTHFSMSHLIQWLIIIKTIKQKLHMVSPFAPKTNVPQQCDSFYCSIYLYYHFFFLFLFQIAGMDTGRYIVQNISGDFLFQCSRFALEHGVHYLK